MYGAIRLLNRGKDRLKIIFVTWVFFSSQKARRAVYGGRPCPCSSISSRINFFFLRIIFSTQGHKYEILAQSYEDLKMAISSDIFKDITRRERYNKKMLSIDNEVNADVFKFKYRAIKLFLILMVKLFPS